CQAIDGCVVSAPETDEQIALRLRRHSGRTPEPGQHLLEISRSHLGRSAGAGGVGSQTSAVGQTLGHSGHGTTYEGRSGDWDSTKARKAWASGDRLRSRCVTRWNARDTSRSRTGTHPSNPVRHSSSTARREIREMPNPARIACL